MLPAFAHDLILYQVPPGLARDEFLSALRDNFKSHPFVRAIVKLVQQEKPARFGLVNEWIQANCSDKPTPYRWEIKENTHILYDWLDYFFEEIKWDVPGRHSQVIRWEDN